MCVKGYFTRKQHIALNTTLNIILITISLFASSYIYIKRVHHRAKTETGLYFIIPLTDYKTMSHITVERNRRRQMNEHLKVLRSLTPRFYIKRVSTVFPSSYSLTRQTNLYYDHYLQIYRIISPSDY